MVSRITDRFDDHHSGGDTQGLQVANFTQSDSSGEDGADTPGFGQKASNDDSKR